MGQDLSLAMIIVLAFVVTFFVMIMRAKRKNKKRK